MTAFDEARRLIRAFQYDLESRYQAVPNDARREMTQSLLLRRIKECEACLAKLDEILK